MATKPSNHPFATASTRSHPLDATDAWTFTSDLTPAAYNPRTIGTEQLAALRRSMAAFGDLSGIVFNRRTARLVGGHQRLKSIDASPITIDTRFAHPTAQGTVALGYVDIDGERWAYREVDWDEQTERGANIAANAHGGEFDLPLLAAVVGNLDTAAFDLSLTGLGDKRLAALLQWADDGPNNPVSAPQLDETKYQVVITCATEQMQAALCNELEARGYACRLLML